MSDAAREKLKGNKNAAGRIWSKESREKMRQIALSRPPHSPETREKIRQARLRQTLPTKMTKLEQSLRTEFKKRRLKFEMNKTMFSRWQPDFVFEAVKLIVQADGDYWHRQSTVNVERDQRFNTMAHQEGWTVWRFAETEIRQHPEACGRAVARFVRFH